jgi:thiamine-monophosphate kinase
MTTLVELGERTIIEKIISIYCNVEIGDDCAEILRDNESIIVTMDPVPTPAAEVIAKDADPFWKGWLLATINASDLAAAGADPLAFFVAAEAPAKLCVSHFERFLEGVSSACRLEGLVYAGGNIREGNNLNAVGTAIGTRSEKVKLSRKGITDGDVLAIIGVGGRFWMDALRYRAGDTGIDKHSSPLFSPVSQGKPMRSLVSTGLLVAAMDNSDGLLSTIFQLAERNNIGAIISLDTLSAPPGYDIYKKLINISHERLWLGWGDWNVVVAVRPNKVKLLRHHCKLHSIPLSVCGVFSASVSGLKIKSFNEFFDAPRLESERFSKDSWFLTGIEEYIERLKSIELPGSK